MNELKELEYTIVEEDAVSDELDRALRDALVVCFPKDGDHFLHQRWWHSLHNRTVVATERDGSVAGALCVIERMILVGESRLNIAGIGNVCTVPPWRKKGIIDCIMAMALDEAKRRGFETGLLFCKPELEKVYTRMGWKRIDATVVMDDEHGVKVPLPENDVTMWIPILADRFPPGDIDLLGRNW